MLDDSPVHAYPRASCSAPGTSIVSRQPHGAWGLGPVQLPSSHSLVPMSQRVELAGLAGPDSKEKFPTPSGQWTVLCLVVTVLTDHLHRGPWPHKLGPGT